MTLGHAPGSLNAAAKFSGTLSSLRFGTFPASKLYGGTYTRPVSGGPYGSVGSLAGRVLRLNLGSIRGSVSAHRASIAAFPGTVRMRLSGTRVGVYYSAPPQPRYVSIMFNCVPNVTSPVINHLRQSAGGTIARAGISADVSQNRYAELAGWVLPGNGSYVVGSLSGALVGFSCLAWREWDP